MKLTLSGLGVASQTAYYMYANDPCMDPSRNNPTFGHFSFMNTVSEDSCWAAKGINTGGDALILGTPGQSQALTPGLPVGYDPATGKIDPSNTTGATQTRSITDAIAADNPPIDDPDSQSLACSLLGIGCTDGSGTLNTLMVMAMIGLGAYIFFGLRSNK